MDEHRAIEGEKRYHKPSTHKRVMKNVEARFERYAYAIETLPQSRRGAWRALFAERVAERRGYSGPRDGARDGAPDGAPDGPRDGATADAASAPLVVDLGCGKGRFAVKLAQEHPDWYVVGIDYEETCIATGAKYACTGIDPAHPINDEEQAALGIEENSLPNLLFVLASADELADFFAPGEVSTIFLNYPTPFPQKKRAAMRLTSAARLLVYREVLAEGGAVELRTDSQPLFDWTLLQLPCAGFELRAQSRDLFAGSTSGQTNYEQKLTERGAKVHALTAVPGALPAEDARTYTGPLSLMDFLPEDLEALEYVPFGMENAVENFRNKRRNGSA